MVVRLAKNWVWQCWLPMALSFAAGDCIKCVQRSISPPTHSREE